MTSDPISALLPDLIEDLLTGGNCIRLEVGGVSMAPGLRDGDFVTIAPLSGEDARFGDLVLFRNASGVLILHRVVRRWRTVTGTRRIQTRGDATVKLDASIDPVRVLGRVRQIERSGTARVDLDSMGERLRAIATGGGKLLSSAIYHKSQPSLLGHLRALMRFPALLTLTAALTLSVAWAQSAENSASKPMPATMQGDGAAMGSMQQHGTMGGSQTPPDLSTAKTSNGGLFHASIEHRPNDFGLNEMHRCELRVTFLDGRPLPGATILVDGGMPAHGHGLPTAPRVTGYLGDGRYLVEGMKFNMAGLWNLRFDISHGDARDYVVFNLQLK
jgi:hypothetical protein